MVLPCSILLCSYLKKKKNKEDRYKLIHCDFQDMSLSKKKHCAKGLYNMVPFIEKRKGNVFVFAYFYKKK